MGCAQSKIDNEESVSRCKDRRIQMKEALAARNAFAAAHSAYAIALKDTGVALSGYANGEAPVTNIPEDPTSYHPASNTASAVAPPPPPPPPPLREEHPLPPAPPPLPSFSPSPVTLERSVTMPEISVLKRDIPKMESVSSIPEDSTHHIEEDDEDEDDDEDDDEHGDEHHDEMRGNGKGIEGFGGKNSQNGGDGFTHMGNINGAWDYFAMDMRIPSFVGNEEIEEVDEEDDEEEEEEDEEEDDDEDGVIRRGRNGGIGYAGGGFGKVNNEIGGEFEFRTPEKSGGVSRMEVVDEEIEMETPLPTYSPMGMSSKHFVHSNTAPAELKSGAKLTVVNNEKNSVIWFKVLKEIDDHFLQASQSAQEVSRMLEANRFHYHHNFADARIPVDHAARVMRVITWNRPVNGMDGDGAEGGRKDDYYADESETHAIVLDKMLAWEKKLYEEVKAAELMKLEYHRKVTLLNRQKKRGASIESLEKTKAVVSHLHTRYIVDMQSMDSTVSEVDDLRDQQLYPKLVELADGMARMWDDMCAHHAHQLQLIMDIKGLEISLSPRETSADHYRQTIELRDVIERWKSQFEKLVDHQKNYVRHLYSWLKLNLIPIETTLKEKVSSPPRIQTPPIQPLLQSWHDIVEKLPDELVKTAISSFAAVIGTIIHHQEEEMKLKEKCMETQKEYLRKSQAFDDWWQKHVYKLGNGAAGIASHRNDMGVDRGGGEEETSGAMVVGKDPVSERKFVVDSLKKRLLEDVEAHQRQCLQVREKSLGSLKTRLPELFRAMSDYSHACADGYNRLRGIVAMSQNSKRPS